jgi:hypothetical protein
MNPVIPNHKLCCRATQTFKAGPGVASFEVPLFPGQQQVKVTRAGVVMVDVIGSEIVNASTNPAVIALCDHQTFTGSALLGSLG